MDILTINNNFKNYSPIDHTHESLIRGLCLGRENGSDDLSLNNDGFITSGWWGGILMGDNRYCPTICHITFNIKTSKNSVDWCFQLKSGLRPCHPVYFPYYLGNQLCRGRVQTDGYVYFETLNTYDALSASFSFLIG